MFDGQSETKYAQPPLKGESKPTNVTIGSIDRNTIGSIDRNKNKNKKILTTVFSLDLHLKTGRILYCLIKRSVPLFNFVCV